MAIIHAVDKEGELRRGVPAFLAVWEQLPLWNALPPILRAVPGALLVAEAAYRLFARHRLRITGRARSLGEGSACAAAAAPEAGTTSPGGQAK